MAVAACTRGSHCRQLRAQLSVGGQVGPAGGAGSLWTGARDGDTVTVFAGFITIRYVLEYIGSGQITNNFNFIHFVNNDQ